MKRITINRNNDVLEETAYQLTREANITMRADVKRLLLRALSQEKNRRAHKVLSVLLENARCAQESNLPLCQDTGLPVLFIEIGNDICFTAKMLTRIQRGVEKAYEQEAFRASSVYPFEKDTFYSARLCHLDFVSRRGLKLTIFPKGFGSENKSQLRMFNPTAGRAQIDEFIIKAVLDAGPAACPPFFIGIGVGGMSDTALLDAKRALLQRIDVAHSDTRIAMWEKDLYRKINSLNIGPMGFGGRHTALAVKIRVSPTHIAGLPVGINISCHSLRSASRVFSRKQLEQS